MSKNVVVPTTAAIFRPLRSSTFVMPASLRATMAPSTAVATPVTLSGTLSSNILAASANDMSIASTFPAPKVEMRGAGGPPITVYSACHPRLPSRSSLWMISHAAQPSWRYAKRTLPFPWAAARRVGTPAAMAAPAAMPVRRKSRRPTCRPSRFIACPPSVRALRIHQYERVHGHDPASRRDQGVHVQLLDPRMVSEKVSDAHEDLCQRVLVDGRGPAVSAEQGRPAAFLHQRPRRVARERRQPDRH